METIQPLFSVLISNYNNGRYLQDAIDSVIAQTYKNWEIVIVDDGSTDQSINIYKKYINDCRFRISYNKTNTGCGFTKRRCVEIATGEICGFLDSDDVLLPNALESHIRTHINNPNVSCVLSRFYFCDNQLNVIGEIRKLTIPVNKNYFTNRDYMPEHLASFKKKYYNKTIGIDSSLPAGVDQDLYFKMEETAPILFLDEFTYKYRCTETQISQNENWLKAFYWNLIVRHNTCRRRNINDDFYPIKDFSDVFISQKNKTDDAYKELLDIKTSYSYRIGKTILSPISLIKRIIKKSR